MSATSQRILKANDIRSLGSKVVFNYDDMKQRCDEYVAQAEAKAKSILDGVRTEAEATRSKLFELARVEGRNQGLQEAEQEIERRAAEKAEKMTVSRLGTTLPAMEKAIADLVRERDQWRSEWEAAAVQFCLKVAEKIIHRKIETHPEIAGDILRETLEMAAGTPEMTVRLHPDDLELMGPHADQIIRAASSCADAKLEPDATLVRGDCVVETRHGVIDGQLETQLNRIATELLGTGP